MANSIFPNSYYDNTISQNTIRSYDEIPILKDYKINLETGELLVDKDRDFIIIEGLEAVVQMCRRMLLTEKFDANSNKRWTIYPDGYGSKINGLFGKSKQLGDQLAYGFIYESIVENNIYVNSISNFTTELQEGYYTISFSVNSIYGTYKEEMNIQLQD